HAHRVAGALRDHGVTVGDRIGVFAERGHDHLALVVGVPAAGAVYVPLDVRHPAARVAQIARGSGARVVLATAASAAALGDVLAAIPADDRPRVVSLARDED